MTQQTIITDPSGTSRWRRIAALGALSVGTFSFVTTEAAPIGLLTLIAEDLDRSLTTIGSLVSAYAAVVVLASVPLTRLTRDLPRRTLLGGLLAVFAVATLASALAPTFELLLVARLVTALSQALFWSVVAPVATGMFPAHRHGAVVSTLFTGSSLAPVLGIPAGTWLGVQVGWRATFLALAAIVTATCVVVIALLPAGGGSERSAAGEEADARRYACLVVVTALGITGLFSAYTYITAQLLDVAGLPRQSLGVVLLGTGAAGVLGALISGRLVQRRPLISLVVPLATMAAAMLLLFLAGRWLPAAVVAVALLALAGSWFAAALQGRVLRVAPLSTDIASAGSSTAYNAGILAGSWLGGVLVDGPGLPATALAGSLLAAAATLVMLTEPLLARRKLR
ncbi:MFS transporter [Saccharothrix coeruleofusca]|uniref:MFS transporter n=1 Tax=Saccharothrix coeruleofusca TaxID=33919 RepID=A0A918ECC9_9PSEU|nr:MFS transporter [Saccharothrix coeruleofusca]MBP2338378.1 DHA1 family L-arabinose/isopropyl-beta-D-thiogalactopyranoside export protein-like MFS transporter/DHA1 family inner membrane transport protein [Saccharothrix coeruleofusca]GGP48739.1 MFS transporter [Saccharothrix coeruleofusca]